MTTSCLFEEAIASKFPQKIRIYYASQTGQAESISKLIYENFIKNDPELKQIVEKFASNFLEYHCISDYEKEINEFWLDPDILEQNSIDCDKENIKQPKQIPIELLPSEKYSKKPKYLLIIVASTTGQGDPPDKAIKFFRWIRKLKRSIGSLNKNNNNKTSGNVPKQFAHLSYALLGLGDTNYDNFANFSKQLNKIFNELGASEFVEPAFADDAVGLEIVTEPFIEYLNETIKKLFRQTNAITIEKPIESIATINNDGQAVLAELCSADESSNINQNSIKMNLNRPVVSSCVSISSSDKRLLSDICRQLLEPSNQLADMEQLDLPKFTPKSSLISTKFSSFGCVYSQKDLNSLCNKAEIECLTLKEYLQKKAANKPLLHVGKVSLNEILSNHDNSNECCHKRKTVLECDVEYQFQHQSSETNQPIVDDASDQINNSHLFQPGDAYGFYTANQLIDVHQVLNSIKVKCPNVDDVSGDDNGDGDEPILLWDYLKGNRKQAFIILNDQKTVVELLPYLMFGVDLRTIPKKLTLLQLSKYTGDQQQQRRLLELCSKQGNNEYQQLILGQNITICDILRIFDTCHPPLNVFLSQLIVAKPRYFSVSSLPKISRIPDNSIDDQNLMQCNFRIILSVSTNFSHTFMRTTENLLGLFSGKFFQHYNYLPKNFQADLLCSNVWSQMESLHENVINGNIFYDNQDVSLCTEASFPCYLFSRVNQSFKLPMNQTKPLILISTGTGVTPFLCYLEALAQSLDNNSEYAMQKPSEIYFIFGCRHPYQDFVHSDWIISMANSKPKLIDHLCLCFSRCSPTELARFQNENSIELCNDQIGENIQQQPIKHVNQLILLHGKELVDLIINRDATIFVCGNWKKISDGIIKAFCTILAKFHFGNEDCDHTLPEAQKYIKDMKKNCRFIQDIWT